MGIQRLVKFNRVYVVSLSGSKPLNNSLIAAKYSENVQYETCGNF